MKTTFHSIILGLVFPLAGALSSAQAAAVLPALHIQPDPVGLRITWPADAGSSFVLEASEDFETWTEVTLSVVKEDDMFRVLVPKDQIKRFYRLINDGARTRAAYVGSQTCKTCHSPIYDTFIQSGHPWKLVKVENGQAPTWPFSEVPNPPEGYTWADVSWVIGGYNWKARFIDQNGYIITGTNVQYNLATQGWVAYHASDPVGTKPYNCGSCHTTGWDSLDEGSVHQDGLPGMHGSFVEPGITCEACHGPGSEHVATMDPDKIVKDRSAALCGSCHYRGDTATIPASGGFIRHHEQYNEMLSAGHAFQKCVTCHDPHKTVEHGQPGGIIRDCTACHTDYDPNGNAKHHGATCVDCHMPRASKSAVAVNKYIGDVKTHIFKINTAADGQMFTPDGSLANGATGVTLDFVCYQCHVDPDGVGGGTAPMKTLEQLSAKAQGFHNR